jgi:molybdopterin converting factor small subunit
MLLLIAMIVTLRYYGILTDLAGKISDVLKISKGSNFSDLLHMLYKAYPGFQAYPVIFFQNAMHCNSETLIRDEAEIDCMPAFSGG